MQLHITNLSPKTTEEMLRELFEGYGPVETIEIEWAQKAGRSFGKAIVQMGIVDANEAARELNGHPLNGRRIYINALHDTRPTNLTSVSLKARATQNSK